MESTGTVVVYCTKNLCLNYLTTNFFLLTGGSSFQRLQIRGHATPHLLHGPVSLPQHAVYSQRSIFSVLRPVRLWKNLQLPALRSVSSYRSRRCQQRTKPGEINCHVDDFGKFRQLQNGDERQRYQVYANLQFGL